MRQLKAFITKSNLHKVKPGINDLYLVTGYNEYSEYMKKEFRSKQITTGYGEELYILTAEEIKRVMRSVDKRSSYSISDLIYIMPLTGFNEHDIELLKDEIKNSKKCWDNVTAEYGLVQMDIKEFM